MIEIFADTFYYLALLNPRDTAHRTALAITKQLTAPVVTTHWVLMEVADALAAPKERQKFLSLLAALEGDPSVTIIPPNETHFRHGVDLFRSRPDKNWPLTDCISFSVMTERGITDALTGDEHFRQSGFIPLLASTS